MLNLEQGTALWQVIAAVVIFLGSYALIISEKINRSIVALAGALLMVFLGIVNFHTAYTEHIHWDAIFLLLGMMMLVGIVNESGAFKYIAVKTAQSAHGDPGKILIRLAILTAVGSAFVDNVTTVLLISPITIAIARILHINAVPYLIMEILICNIGGAATLVGDPPNIMIGSAADISFNDFIVHITPIIIVILFITIFFFRFYFKKHMQVDDKYKDALKDINANDFIRDSKLVKKSIFVSILTLAGFVTHQFFNVEPAVIAMSGATLLMLIGTRESELEKVFHSVEWITIFFFGGLFILVGGLIETGVIRQLSAWMIGVTHGNTTLTSMVILWGAGLASAIVDNIPLVATMIPMIQDMTAQLPLSQVEVDTLWWSLVLGACLGGNGTLIASSANLVVAAVAVKEGSPISFTTFLKVSIPVTLVSLMVATLYIYVVCIRLGFA